MIMHNKEDKGGRFTICLISYIQILNSVLQQVVWIFCDLFTFSVISSTFMYCLFPLTCVVVFPFSFEQEEKRVKVMAGSNLIMLSNTVMRWALSPRRHCTAVRFLGGLMGNFWQITNKPGGSADNLTQCEWHVDLVVGRWLSGKFDSDIPLSSGWKICNWFILPDL